jgi:flavodoxin
MTSTTKTQNAAVVYWSQTGNTEKVAHTIADTLEAQEVDVDLRTVDEAAALDFYGYDLLCVGFPPYQWSPPAPVDRWLKQRFNAYKREGRVKVGAPPVPGKHVVLFCTYSGPHTGIREATPALDYAGQFFEHLGLPVADSWYVVGEFHGREVYNTQGRLGDIRGRPNAEDLAQVREKVAALLARP